MASPVEQPLTLPSVKTLADSPCLKAIPPKYAYSDSATEFAAAESGPHQVSIPIIDCSLLSSGNPDQHLQAVRDLGRACQDWGFFMVVNHGIPESLIEAILEVTDDFFNLPEEEKMEYQTKHFLDPIRYGTSFNASKEQVFFWRDYLKVLVHPHFHCPQNPKRFSDLLSEYAQRARQLALKLLGAIAQSLALEEDHIHTTLDLDSGQQIFTANYYPPCPQPELAMGLPPHSDHGLLTLLLQNGVGGLQIQHQGKWVQVNALPNSFLVNTGDHLEIFSNGRYRSVLHRAAVNYRVKRISIALTHGPPLEAEVGPSPRLLLTQNPPEGEDTQVAAEYRAIKYGEYLELQQCNKLDGKSCLDRVRRIIPS